jgi:hypothetical protein
MQLINPIIGDATYAISEYQVIVVYGSSEV